MTRLKVLLSAVVIALLAMAPGANAAGDVVVYNATNPKLVNKIVEAFKAKNPGINVEIINNGTARLNTSSPSRRNRCTSIFSEASKISTGKSR